MLKINCGIPIQKVPLDRYWIKIRMCFSVKIPVEWDINQLSRWNLRWDTMWRSCIPKNVILGKQRCQVCKRKKSRKNRIYILYTLWVVEMEDVKLVNNATLCINATRHNVAELVMGEVSILFSGIDIF